MSKAAYNVYAAGGATPSFPFIEDFFGTTLYNGNARYSVSAGSVTGIRTGVPLSNTASWSCTTLSNGVYNNDDYSSTKFDSSGNQYVITTNPNKTVLLTTKINSSGVVQWTRSITAPASVTWYPTSIDFDSSGNVYASIYKYTGSTNSSSSVLLKYNSSGTLQWQREQIRGTGNTNPLVFYDMKLNSSGDLFAVGQSTQSGTTYGIVCKYNSSGTIQWSLRLTGTDGNAYGQNCFPDGSGNVYVTLYNYMPTAGGDHLVKIDSSGSVLWQRKMVAEASNSANFSKGTVDSSGNILLSGSVYGTSGGITSNMAMLLKYNSSGTLQWSRYFNSEGYASDFNTALNGVVCDSSNNIYVAGRKYNPASSYDWVVAKYNSSGTLQWSKQLTNYHTSDTPYSIFIHPITGKLVIFGKTTISGYSGNACWVTMPTDGTATSGYAGIYMEPVSPSLVERTPSPVESAGGLTTSFGSAENGYFTDSAGSFTDTSGTSLGFSTLTQNEVVSAGGLVWIKQRTDVVNHQLMDTVQGPTFSMATNNTVSRSTDALKRISFTASGFSLGYDGNNGLTNRGLGDETYKFTSWSFREQPKFFDVVTYTGNGTAGRTVAHNLGSVPGMIIVKMYAGTSAASSNWLVYHRSLGNTKFTYLNTTGAEGTVGFWNNTTPSATEFTVGSFGQTNESGSSFVAYLFAHDAGGFGLTGTDNVISCGSYTGTGSTAQNITLSYEPQWVMIKRTDTIDSWIMVDTMRGFFQTADNALEANSSNAEATGVSMSGAMQPTATGFRLFNANSAVNASGGTYIYIAIRRGPMKVPTLGTSVYNAIARTGTGATASVTRVGFPTDLTVIRGRSSGHSWRWGDRLRGAANVLRSNLTNAELTTEADLSSFNMDGISLTGTGASLSNGSGAEYINYFFRRAPGFFDEVCYTGNGTGANNQTHNLGVQPEMCILRQRNDAVSWQVVHKNDGVTAASLALNLTNATIATSVMSANFTSTYFKTADSTCWFEGTNGNTFTFVAYLFATCAGVSKVGSYTGNGSTQTINCGFAAGARFVLIKRTDSTGDWYTFDTVRGIVADNEPFLLMNASTAEVGFYDVVDPVSSGFIVNNDATNFPINVASATYIFLAIA